MNLPPSSPYSADHVEKRKSEDLLQICYGKLEKLIFTEVRTEYVPQILGNGLCCFFLDRMDNLSYSFCPKSWPVLSVLCCIKSSCLSTRRILVSKPKYLLGKVYPSHFPYIMTSHSSHIIVSMCCK